MLTNTHGMQLGMGLESFLETRGLGSAAEADHESVVQLLHASRRGNQEAAREMIRLYGGSMVKTAWRVLGRYGRADAEDIVQEAFIAALTTSALPTGDLGAWLRSITARKALDAIRKTKRLAE